MERVSFRVEGKTLGLLMAESRATGVSPSDVVREALEARLGSKRESCLDIAARIGIVGCVDNLPPDASTNKGYLRGLGRDPR